MSENKTDSPGFLSNPFWEFSISVYNNPRIHEISLSLQDGDGANVNLLLYCCWLAYAVENLSQDEFTKACKTISEWQKNVTSNLRLARRAINDAGKENQEWVGQFMKQLLNIEIMSESYQQNCLYLAIKNKYSNACKTDIEKATHYMIWLYELMGCPVDEAKKKTFQEYAREVFSPLKGHANQL